MKTNLLAALAIASFVAVPNANAQNYYHGWHNNGGAPFNQNQINTLRFDQAWINDMQAKINRGVQSGRLSRGEAANLQARLNNIQNMQSRMGINGLNYRERQKLNDAIERENQAINRDLHNGEFVGSSFFTRWHHY